MRLLVILFATIFSILVVGCASNISQDISQPVVSNIESIHTVYFEFNAENSVSRDGDYESSIDELRDSIIEKLKNVMPSTQIATREISEEGLKVSITVEDFRSKGVFYI